MARQVEAVAHDVGEDEVQTIKHLDGWLSFYEVAGLLQLTKQGIHRLVFESAHFDVADEVRGIPFSAAHTCYVVRASAVRREMQRRIAKGLLEDPNKPAAQPAKRTARTPRRGTGE